MKSNSVAKGWFWIAFLVVVLVVSTGVATAAVTGSFDSSYDGYNDGTDTDARGHEIQVSGTLEFSGENAVNPQILVRDTQYTVLDESSVQLLQPGDTSINFEKRYTENGVMYTASEVPSGTTLDLRFVTYPVSGLDRSEIESAQVLVSYERPGGGNDQNRISVTTSIDNTPTKVISSINQGDQVSIVVQILAVIGGLALLLVLVMTIYSVVSGEDDDNPVN